jgi:hypothetical protein
MERALTLISEYQHVDLGSEMGSKSETEFLIRNRHEIGRGVAVPAAYLSSLLPLRQLVGAKVGELEFYADVFAFEEGHDFLEGVSVLADDADGVTLNAGLGFFL